MPGVPHDLIRRYPQSVKWRREQITPEKLRDVLSQARIGDVAVIGLEDETGSQWTAAMCRTSKIADRINDLVSQTMLADEISEQTGLPIKVVNLE